MALFVRLGLAALAARFPIVAIAVRRFAPVVDEGRIAAADEVDEAVEQLQAGIDRLQP
ncbi:hypothetical protein CATMIT_01574, partial [Catenibacterium mitsuokai DSM 15897]